MYNGLEECLLEHQHQLPTLFVFTKPVLGVINKDCTKAECLHSSQTKCLSKGTI